MAGPRLSGHRARSRAALQAENVELRLRLTEMQETWAAIQNGDVDGLIVSNDVFVLESAGAASNRLRQDVLNQMQDAVFAFDNAGHLIYLNAAAELNYGLDSSDALGRPKAELFSEVDLAALAADASGRPKPELRPRFEATHVLPNGNSMFVEASVSMLQDASGQSFGTLEVVRDVTQRRQAELRNHALARLSERLRDLDDLAAIGREASHILGGTLDASRSCVARRAGQPRLREHGAVLDALKRGDYAAIAGLRLDAECGWNDDDLLFVREVAERTRTFSEKVRNAHALRESESRLRAANEGLEAAVEARTRELMTAQLELRQSQKMEAVGQLTGGIAHDFNNLLGGMSASLQLLQSRLQRGKTENIERYLAMSQESVKRAAALTQRLLAFARRQTLDPKPTDVNRLITGLEEMIRRTVGPNVVVEVVGAGGLWPTKIDPSQLENSLINLCINARDAMLPDGGRLTIETANKWLDERVATERELAPGQYVSLCVTDTGSGMSAEVIERIFDPFFTTKPLGQGTGLGLSMVYGFVRQSGGQVRVYSEVGRGTTMCLYLPRHRGPVDAVEQPVDLGADGQGDGERVLVIDDEATIRVLIAEVLEEAGYKVLTAEDGPSGLRILQAAGRIDMLVTDVGLPGGLNGRQVADAARKLRPALKVLFITGYAENATVGNGLLGSGMQVLTKPFDLMALTRKVREMTEAPPLPPP